MTVTFTCQFFIVSNGKYFILCITGSQSKNIYRISTHSFYSFTFENDTYTHTGLFRMFLNTDFVLFCCLLVGLSTESCSLKTKPTALPANRRDPLQSGTLLACLKSRSQPPDLSERNRGAGSGRLEVNRFHNMWGVVLVWDQ